MRVMHVCRTAVDLSFLAFYSNNSCLFYENMLCKVCFKSLTLHDIKVVSLHSKTDNISFRDHYLQIIFYDTKTFSRICTIYFKQC